MRKIKHFLAGIILFAMHNISAQDIAGPAGSGAFGTVTVLPNGNFVVVDAGYDEGAISNVGAVYLYNGATKTIISTLKGSTANDAIGSQAITVLTNGNYVIRSQTWDNGAVSNAGAVTWGSATTGVSGVVSSSNSLVGSRASDGVGNITSLTNGNYVVVSPQWDNGGTTDAGAVTWCNGTTGRTGTISSSNSLVGSTASDFSGTSITTLTNGNYVVRSFTWDNGATINAGAVTWGNGTTGIAGTISSSNSLVGSTAFDQVGGTGVTALTNGNYVVMSTFWNNGATSSVGAVTWGDGTTGITGVVSSSNSLIGSTAGDQVGTGVTALTNGNYVVTSTSWDNGAIVDAGAVTWGNGTTGTTGVISSSNSLVGSTASDQVGTGVTALTNGNYVVTSTSWDNGGVANLGAVTWGNGITGITGFVSSSNSLIGSTAGDKVGTGVTALTNGNYVVRSTFWDNGAIVDAGAVTWGNGTTGITGTISSSNSLVGSKAIDALGTGVTPLSNGNYVVTSINWDNGATLDVGAITWGNGTTGVSGVVSSSNSLIGSTANDAVGLGSVKALTNGNYVVINNGWDNGAIVNARAATLGNGTTGTTGVITACNSVLGEAASDITAAVFNTVYDYMITSKTVSNKINISNLLNNVTPSVSIVSSDADNSIAPGTSVTFTATPTNGGNTPDYQWKVNDTNAGTNSATFTTTSLAHNDSITVVLTRNQACVNPITATSNAIVTAVIIPTTQIQSSFNATTVATMTTPIYADNVLGAEAYTYKVVNGDFSYEKERTGTNMGYFNFSQIPGVAFGTTYTITVKIKMSGVYGNYGSSVTITTPSVTALTKLNPANCGATLTTLGQRIYATPVTGATGYRFEVTANGNTTTFDTAAYYFTLANVGGGQYDQSYSVRVATLLNGTYGSFGDACIVTTPLPTSKVINSQCGLTLPTISTPIAADFVPEATNYTFEITHNGIIYYFESGYNFKLRFVTGLPVLTNSVYAVRVKLKINGTYGAYGTSCNVTTPATRDGEFDDEFTDFTVTSYPNPFAGTFQLDLKSTSNNEINVMVYDMLGKQIENRSFNALEVYNQTFGANYATGIYNVMVSQNGTTKTVRVIKN